jgi:hypothetical protein
MQPTLVPDGGTALDVLAVRYRAAFDKMEGGRAQWIEGTLELAVVVAEAKIEWPGNAAFSQWLYLHKLALLHPNDRAALVGFAQDLKAARVLLEKSNSISWRVIWENRPKRAPTKIGKSPHHVKSGAEKKNRVPDVMRDETPMPQKRLSDYGLTREQVDPDFKGTAVEFAAKYGPVNLHTKDQIEHNKRQEALMAWLGAVTDHARTAQALLLATAVDPATLQEWKGKAGKAEKLHTWLQTIQAACNALGQP